MTSSSILIPEIVAQILCNLSQFDLLTILRVSRLFYPVAKEALYRSITIHSNFTQFDQEYFEAHTTYIRTKSNIQALFSNTENLPLIRELNVVKLPLEFIEFESYLCQTFLSNPDNYAHTLQRLNLNHPTNMCLLHDLGLDDRLRSLQLKINVYSQKTSAAAAASCSGARLNHLESLSVGPVKDNDHLRSLMGLVTNRDQLSGLRVVKQCKKIKLEELLQSTQSESMSRDDSSRLENNLVSEFRGFRHLKRLSLENMTIKGSRYCSIVNPEELEYLSLSNVNEICEPGESILTQFAETGMPHLKRLRLSVRQSVQDSTSELLASLAPNSLDELDLELRYNMLKEDSLDKLVDRYIVGIHRQALSLKKLSFSVFTEKSLVDMENPLSAEQFQHLFLDSVYPRLENLRIQVHFDTLYNKRIQFFHRIPFLTKLWIMGSNAVEKHWGLGNAYPGIFDNWLRIQHLPKNLVDDSEGLCFLKYIKIDKCLFQMRPREALPRDCIDDWFDRATRVCYSA